MADVDRLEIKIGANASSSSKSLDALISRMENLSEALSKCTSSYKQTKQSSEGASRGMKKTADAAKNLGKTEAQIRALSKAFSGLASGIKNLSASGFTAFSKMITAPLNAGKAIFSFNKNLITSVSNLKPFSRGAKTAQEGLSGLISKVTGLVAKLYILKTALGGIWKSATSAMDFIETYHYFDVAFKKIGDEAEGDWRKLGYDSAQAYAESFKETALSLTEQMTGYAIDKTGNPYKTDLKSLGMDPDMVMQYQAQFAQMANGLGMTADAAEKTSRALTMLGADWSSLRNLDFETSYEKMASALAGQTRAVRSLGVDISQATLQQYAYEAGLTTSISKMNQATKAQLRMIAILDQSKVAWADMANTLNTPANQFRLLKQNVASLARTIGNILLPILKFVLPYINAVVIALRKLFEWIAGLVGADLNGLATGIGGIEESMEDFESPDYEEATTGTKKFGEEAEEAEEKLKELKKTILGFDELNVLNEPEKKEEEEPEDLLGNNPLGSGVGVPPALNSMLDQLLNQYQKKWDDALNHMQSKAEEIAQKIVDAFKKKDWYGLGRAIADLINAGLDHIYIRLKSADFQDKLNEIAKALADFINGLSEGIHWYKLGQVVGAAINDVVNALNTFLERVNWTRLGGDLAKFVNGLVDEIDATALGNLIGNKFQAAVDFLYGFFTTLEWEDLGLFFGDLLNGAMEKIDASRLGATISTAINGAFGALKTFIERFNWDELTNLVTTGVNRIIIGVNWWNIGNILANGINHVLSTATNIINGIKWGWLGKNLNASLNGLVQGLDFEGAANFVTSALNGVIKTVNGFLTNQSTFEKLAIGIARFFNLAIKKTDWEGIKNAIHNAIKTALNALEFFRKEFDFDALAEKIRDFFKDAVDSTNWDLAAQTLSNWIRDICEFLIKALPTQATWSKLGKRIGELIEAIPWAELLATAIEVFKNAFLGLVEGLGETTAGKIVAGIIAFKISTTMLLPFADGLVKTITGDHISKLLVDGIKSLFSKSLKSGAEEAAKEVGTTVASTLAGGATGGGAGAGAGGGGAAATGGIVGPLATALGLSGAIYGTTLLGQKIQEAWDKAKGGNGVITDFGFTTETVLDKLRPLLGDQYQIIWNTMEALENSGANADTFGKTLKKALEDAGVPGEEVERVIAAMNGELQLSQTQIGLLETVTEGYTAKAKSMKETLDFSNVGVSFSEFKDTIETNCWELTEGLDGSQTSFENLKSALINFTTDNSENEFNALIEKMKEMGIPEQRIIDFMKVHFPEAVQTTTTAKNTAVSNFGDIKTSIESIGTNIQNTVGPAFETISNVVSTKSESIKGFVEKAFGFIGTKIKTETSDASTNTDKAMKAIEAEVDRATSSAKAKTETNTKGMSGLFESFGTSAKGVYDDLVRKVGTSFDTMTSDSKTKYGQTETNVKTTNEAINLNFKDTWETLHTFVKDTLDALNWTVKGRMKIIGESIDGKMKEIAEAIPKPFENVGENIASKFENVPTKIKEKVGTKIEEMMKTIADSCPKKFDGVDKNIANKFNNTADKVKTALSERKFGDVGTTMSKKIVSAFNSVKQSIANQFNNTSTYVYNALSPRKFYDVGVAMATSLSNGMSRTHINLPHLTPSWSRVTYGPPGQESWFNFPETFNVSWYARGGFPKFGELFMANEKGPEMIGSMGRKNVVANNAQIAEGIRAAVVDGMMEVFMVTGGGQSGQAQAPVIEFTWKTDNETLYRQTIRGREKMAGRGFKVDAAF